jgi:ADP-ribose pyrophosphatase
MQSHGPWQIVSSRQVYGDPWIEVHRDEVIRPDGLPGSHCTVRMKAGVCVLALDDEGCVHLTEEFHYAIGRMGLEAVSGGIEVGEDALSTARRELREELGFEADRWTSIGTIDPFTTIIVSPTALFLAEELRPVPRELEGTELIRPVSMTLAEALHLLDEGAITHGPTCVLLLQSLRRTNA